MSTQIGKWVLILGLLGFSSPTHAKDIYIAQAATGAANGADCADARPYTFFNTGSNWGGGSTQIGPGTTVHICGTITGTANNNILAFQGSGTSGSPITLQFESNAVLTSPYCGIDGGACVNLDSRSYVVVDGGTNGLIQDTANGTILANQKPSAAIFATGCSNCEFKNLTVANMYVHTSTSDVPNLWNDGCIYMNGGNNISIHDNVFHDMHWCLNLYEGTNSSNWSVYNNTIYNIDHGIIVATSSAGTSVSGVNIYNNHIYSYANWDVSNNAYHHDGIHIFDTLHEFAASNITIYNNKFEGPVGVGVNCHIFVEVGSAASGITIYNNVLFSDAANNDGMIGLYSGSNDILYNNTLVGPSSAVSLCMGINNSVTNLAFENNVMTSCEKLIDVEGGSGFTGASPNNNIYANGGTQSFGCDSDYYLFTQFLSWQRTSCARSEETRSLAPASAMLSATGTPLAGSPLIGAGANLASMCTGILSALCDDKNGNARPASGAWDAGAYVGTVSVNQPAAPTGLTATVN